MEPSVTTKILDAMQEAKEKVHSVNPDGGDYTMCYKLGADTYATFLETALLKGGVLDVTGVISNDH